VIFAKYHKISQWKWAFASPIPTLSIANGALVGVMFGLEPLIWLWCGGHHGCEVDGGGWMVKWGAEGGLWSEWKIAIHQVEVDRWKIVLNLNIHYWRY
jgi:hypothetical protein